jgi:hypothetical protein
MPCLQEDMVRDEYTYVAEPYRIMTRPLASTPQLCPLGTKHLPFEPSSAVRFDMLIAELLAHYRLSGESHLIILGQKVYGIVALISVSLRSNSLCARTSINDLPLRVYIDPYLLSEFRARHLRDPVVSRASASRIFFCFSLNRLARVSVRVPEEPSFESRDG